MTRQGAWKSDTRLDQIVNSYRFVAIALALCGAGSLFGCGSKPPAEAKKEDPQPTLQIVPVTRGSLESILPVTGTLQALPGRETTLTPPVAGVLTEMHVRYGQSVQKGQVIARLSTRQLLGQVQQAQAMVGQNLVQVQQAEANALQQQAQTRTTILQAQAGVRNAQATLAGAQATLIGNEAAVQNARQTLNRAQTLFADGLIPQKDVETAQLALRTAEAQRDAQRQTVDGQRQTIAGQQQALAAAQASSIQNLVKRKDVQVARQQVRNALGALTTARAQFALYTLHAPLSGQVTLVGANAGETVDTTTKIAMIANLNTLQLQISIPGDATAQVHAGETLTFTVGSLSGQIFRATLTRVGSQVDPTSGTVPAFAVVANPGGRLRDDTTVQARIVTQRRANALLIPQTAILTDPDTRQTSVVVVGPDSVAHLVPVETGLSANGSVEIQSGLAAGQKVAVSGQYGLPDGTKVAVENAPAPGGSSKAPAPDVSAPGNPGAQIPSAGAGPARVGGASAPTVTPGQPSSPSQSSPGASSPPAAPSVPNAPAPAPQPPAPAGTGAGTTGSGGSVNSNGSGTGSGAGANAGGRAGSGGGSAGGSHGP